MAARLGSVLYWACCGLAGLLALSAVALAAYNGFYLVTTQASDVRVTAESDAEKPWERYGGTPTVEERHSRLEITPERERQIRRNQARSALMFISPFLVVLAGMVWLLGRSILYVLAGR